MKKTLDYKITYWKGQGVLELKGFSDSDWASEVNQKSLGSYVFILAKGPITWACKRNQSICLSSTEVEYKALRSGAKEAIWIRRCLADIGHEQKNSTVINCDNQGAIAMSNNPVFHSHTAIYHHFIRDTVASKEIRLEYINTLLNVADLLTKPLLSELHKKHCVRLNLTSDDQVRVTRDSRSGQAQPGVRS